jgi:hypothetical protein
MKVPQSLDQIIGHIGVLLSEVPDHRVGRNKRYLLSGILLLIIALFFTKSESLNNFYESILTKDPSLKNIIRIFHIVLIRPMKTVSKIASKIPVANTIRNILDGISTTAFTKVFHYFYNLVKNIKDKDGKYVFNSFNGRKIIALDGTQYLSSNNVSCDNCCTKTHNKNTANPIKEHVECFLPAVLVSIPLKLVLIIGFEFIRNVKEYEKQDCEINAAKRLIPRLIETIGTDDAIILGDDIYAHQPLIELITQNSNYQYIFTCKPKSHKEIFNNQIGLSLHTKNVIRAASDGKSETITYKWINQIQLRDKDSILTNYVEYTSIISNSNVKTNNKNAKKDIVQHFSYITNIKITNHNVEDIVKTGRARWQIENNDFNTMKNHGYNLEHNFGHGKKTLCCIFVILLAIAFNLHIIADIIDQVWHFNRLSFKTLKAFHNYIKNIITMFTAHSINKVLKICKALTQNKGSP